MRPRPLVVATTNTDKVIEIREILAGTPFDLLTLADFPRTDAPDENGHTFEENALIKAMYYARVTGEMVVAEDSGLEIDALDGAPGVESARFGGVGSSYPEKFALIYDALRAKTARKGQRRGSSARSPLCPTGAGCSKRGGRWKARSRPSLAAREASATTRFSSIRLSAARWRKRPAAKPRSVTGARRSGNWGSFYGRL